MIKILNMLLAITLVTASAFSVGEALDKLIIGTWCEDPSEVGVCTGYTVYYEDNTYFSYGLHTGLNIVHNSSGVYEIKDNIGCIHPTSRTYYEYFSGKEVELEIPMFSACSLTESYKDRKLIYRWVKKNNEFSEERLMVKVSHMHLRKLPFYEIIENIAEEL